MAKQNVRVNEEALLKALDRLESSDDDEAPTTKKSATALPRSTRDANGGFSGKGGEGRSTSELETDADEKDPTGASRKSMSNDEDEDEIEKGDEEAEESEESDDDTSKSDSDEEEEDEPAEKAAKSLRSTLEEDDTVSKAVEVSDFLEHLVDQTSDSVDGLRKSIRATGVQQAEFNDMLRKAVVAMGNMLAELNGKIDSFGEEAPAQPRSVMSKALTAGAVEDRSFQGGQQPMFTRDQALDALVSLAEAGKVHPAVVTQYETTGSLPREVQSAVDSFLRQN